MLATADASADVRAAATSRIQLILISTAAAVVYGAAEFLRYYTFQAGTYDLVIFDQAVRSYSRFHLPVSIAAGVHRGFGTSFAVLGDHFSPILALLAPLYWIHAGPRTLLVAQALLFAAAIPPLWVFTRRELGSTWAAYCVAVAYAISWPVAQAVVFDFHEVAFAPVLTAVLFERFSAYRRGGRWWQVVLPGLGLLLVKEDMGLLLAGFGAGVLLKSLHDRRARWLGAGFVVGGLIGIVVTTGFVLPAFGSNALYYWRYGRFGTTMSSAAWQMITHPLTTLDTFVSPGLKIHTMVLLALVSAFAVFLSPWLLTVLPLLADRMLADAPNWWGLDFHYNAFLVVPLLCAGVDAVARLARWFRPALVKTWLGPVWASAVLVIAVCTVHDFAFDPLLHPSSWQRTTDMAAAADVVGRVPSGVTVEAANNLGPQLSDRTTVLLWDRLPRWTPWVVADVRRPIFPFCGVADQQAQVLTLESHGYQVVYQNDGYLVLHHPGPLPPVDTTKSPGC